MEVQLHALTSGLDGGEWSASRTGRFTTSEEAPGKKNLLLRKTRVYVAVNYNVKVTWRLYVI
jgi:hypothetical protein